MGSRGWEHVTPADVERRNARRAVIVQATKPAKYRNVKTVVDGQRFDSQREAEHWIALKIREQAGEITQLRRQVPFPLYAPVRTADRTATGVMVEICNYVCDYEWSEQGRRVVADAKGYRNNKIYLLKKKWLEQQEGIVILEL